MTHFCSDIKLCKVLTIPVSIFHSDLSIVSTCRNFIGKYGCGL